VSAADHARARRERRARLQVTPPGATPNPDVSAAAGRSAPVPGSARGLSRLVSGPVAGLASGVLAAGVAVVVAIPATATPAFAATATGVAQAEEAAGPAARTTPAPPTVGDYPHLSEAAKQALRQRASGSAPDSTPVEDPDARTVYSSTTVDPLTGIRNTTVSTDALNYRDAAGDFQPVDNDLLTAAAKPGGASTGWQNSAAGYDASFPIHLGDPLRIADATNPQQWVSLTLDPAAPPSTATPATATPAAAAPAAAVTLSSAKAATEAVGTTSSSTPTASPTVGSPTVDSPSPGAPEVAPVVGEVQGSEVTYPEVLPGTDIALQAQGSGVKETITVDSSSSGALAAGALTYTLRAGTGLKASEANDQVSVTDAAGKTLFVLPAPFMDDVKGAHSDDIDVTLTPGAEAGTTTLTVTPSTTWLNAPERAWPVVIDPTIQSPDPMLACSLRSAAPTVSNCSGSTVPLSNNSTSGAQERAVLRFESMFDVIPADAVIAHADLQLAFAAPASGTTAPTGTAASVDVRQLMSYYEPGATWNLARTGVAWTTAGSDRASLVSARKQVVANGSYQNFDVSELLQRWVDGTATPAHGFELEKTSAVAGGASLAFGGPEGSSTSAPKLNIIWETRVGDRKGNSNVVSEELDDRTSVSVNPATGNAEVSTDELSIAGVGLDLTSTQTFNSLGADGTSVLGRGWQSSLQDQALHRFYTTMFWTDGAGANWTFYQAVDGSWTRPTGLDADLIANADGTFTLTDRRSKVATTFFDYGPYAGEFYGPSKTMDRNGNTITYTYDATVRTAAGTKLLRSVTDTRGRVLDVVSGTTRTAYLDDPVGRTVGYGYTGDQLTTFTNGAGGNTTYAYDTRGRISAITVPGQQRTELTYDDSNRVLTLTRKEATWGDSVWRFAYTAFDRSTGVPATKTTVTDPNGHNSVYTSDGRGRIGDATDARGKKRSATFTANDDTATATGATAASAGASAGQVTTHTYDAGATGTSAGAASWNLSASRLPTGAGISNTYGTGTRLYDVISSTDARGNATTYAYDNAGNQTTTTTGGVTTKNLYQGNTDPDYGGTVNCGPTVNSTITATKAGLLCETRDGAYVKGSTAAATTAHRVAYRYDAKGQLITMLPGTPSAQQQQTFTYDDLSRLTSVTDGKGQTTSYAYDAMDRQTWSKYADGRIVVSDYLSPGGNGWLYGVEEHASPTATSPDRVTRYDRDQLGRLQNINAPEDQTNLDYDKVGNLTVYADAGGQVRYGYNDADQLTSLALPGGSCTGQSLTSPGAASTKCVLFGVDDDGRRTSTRYPGGQTMAITLDDAGRLKQVIGTTLAGSTITQRLNLAYTYTDAAAPTSATNPNKDTGLVSAVTDALAAAKTTYSHDTLDRLTVASTAPTAGGAVTRYEGFCYDGAGNRTKYLNTTATTCTTGTPAAAFTYNGGNELTTATGVTPTGAALTGTGYSYDGNGNQTSSKSATGLSTTYNAEEAASSFTPVGGTAIAQTYAANEGGNGDRTRSGATDLASSVLSPAPAWSRTGTTSTWTVRDPDGVLVAVRIGLTASSTTDYYPFTDNLDSVRVLTKSDGSLVNNYSYSSYGSTLTISESSGASQPYRYGGGYTDSSTGLIKLGIRYYDPTQGRFTQQDPTGQDFQYLYTGDVPTSFADPTGAIVPVIAVAVLLVRVAAPFVVKGVTKAAVRRAANSGAKYASREAAEKAAKKYAGSRKSCQYRGECAAGNHVHVDRTNRAGDKIHTRHYYYD
jgi:RHS repeat-associated protein